MPLHPFSLTSRGKNFTASFNGIGILLKSLLPERFGLEGATVYSQFPNGNIVAPLHASLRQYVHWIGNHVQGCPIPCTGLFYQLLIIAPLMSRTESPTNLHITLHHAARFPLWASSTESWNATGQLDLEEESIRKSRNEMDRSEGLK